MTQSENVDDRPEVQDLFANLRGALPALEGLFDRISSHWTYEDGVYRFYHRSFKVYALQAATLEIVNALQALRPNRPLNGSFLEIIADGTGREFQPSHNQQWLVVTRPIVEAFFHARYFLEMAIRYARELDVPPLTLPSGWAAFLYLYELR